MNKENNLVPKYRFSEFKDDGDWLKQRIGDLMGSFTGLSGKSGNDFGNGKPYISYKQVFEGNNININECPLVDIQDDENQNNVRYGDVLVTTSSETPKEVGYTNVICFKPNVDTYLNSFCFGLRPKGYNSLDVLFSKYLFKNKEYRDSVVLLAQGVTRYNISKNKVLELKLSIPKNPAEQQKIAACLSSLDDLITGHEEKLTTLEEHKKGLMQNLFPQEGETKPKFRFPEFVNDGDWVAKKLGNLAENLDYKRVPITSTNRIQGNIPYYGASGIIDYVQDYIFDEKLLCISEDGANLLDRNYPIAFTINGKTWVNNHAHVLKFTDFSLQTLIEQYINFINVEEYLTGVAQPKLNRAKLDSIIIPLPVKSKEQQKIAEILSSVDELIVAQREKIEALKEHKKGLMQGMFPKIES